MFVLYDYYMHIYLVMFRVQIHIDDELKDAWHLYPKILRKIIQFHEFLSRFFKCHLRRSLMGTATAVPRPSIVRLQDNRRLAHPKSSLECITVDGSEIW